jgi:hypothetical protein
MWKRDVDPPILSPDTIPSRNLHMFSYLETPGTLAFGFLWRLHCLGMIETWMIMLKCDWRK